MARRSAAIDELSLADPAVTSTAPDGSANPGLIAWRCWVVISWLLLIGFVPPLQHVIQAGFTVLRNWLAPLADQLDHTHHAGRPQSAGPMPHLLLRPGDGVAYFAVPAALTVMWAMYRQFQAIREPGTARFTKVICYTLGGVPVVAAVVAGAAWWQPTRGIAVAVIRALALTLGSLATDVSGFGL
jgi:hypothetical protein